MDDDGRTLSHDKSSHGLWPSELKNKQLKELNIHYLFGSNIVFQTQTCLRTNTDISSVLLVLNTKLPVICGKCDSSHNMWNGSQGYVIRVICVDK